MNYYQLHERWNKLLESPEFTDITEYIEALGLNPANLSPADNVAARIVHGLMNNSKAFAIVWAGHSHGAFPKFEKEQKGQVQQRIDEILLESSEFIDNIDFEDIKRRILYSTYLGRVSYEWGFEWESNYFVNFHIFESMKGLRPPLNKRVKELTRDIERSKKHVENYKDMLSSGEKESMKHTIKGWITTREEGIELDKKQLADLINLYQNMKEL